VTRKESPRGKAWTIAELNGAIVNLRGPSECRSLWRTFAGVFNGRTPALAEGAGWQSSRANPAPPSDRRARVSGTLESTPFLEK